MSAPFSPNTSSIAQVLFTQTYSWDLKLILNITFVGTRASNITRDMAGVFLSGTPHFPSNSLHSTWKAVIQQQHLLNARPSASHIDHRWQIQKNLGSALLDNANPYVAPKALGKLIISATESLYVSTLSQSIYHWGQNVLSVYRDILDHAMYLRMTGLTTALVFNGSLYIALEKTTTCMATNGHKIM